MYSEGEHRYLKDLDWVNIVKSIRELKALSRVILNKYQQEILSFEKDSLLPSDEAYKNKKFDSIYDRLPLEYSGSIQQDEYKGKVVNFLEEYSSKELSNIDLKIIEEVFQNEFKPKTFKTSTPPLKHIQTVQPKNTKMPSRFYLRNPNDELT